MSKNGIDAQGAHIYRCTGSSYIYTVLIAQGPAQIKNIKTKSM